VQWETPLYTDYETPPAVPPARYSHIDVLNNTVRHILFKEPLVTSAASGTYSLELANAITLSSFKNRWVKLPFNHDEYDVLLNSLQKKSKFIKKSTVDRIEIDPRLLKN
jgi:hypothetical protein